MTHFLVTVWERLSLWGFPSPHYTANLNPPQNPPADQHRPPPPPPGGGQREVGEVGLEPADLGQHLGALSDETELQ